MYVFHFLVEDGLFFGVTYDALGSGVAFQLHLALVGFACCRLILL